MQTVAELAALVGGEVLGDGGRHINGVGTLEAARPDEVSFYGNPRYRKAFEATRAGAVLVPAGTPPDPQRTLVAVASPPLAFARVLSHFHPTRPIEPGIRPGAHVDPGARVHADAAVLPGATVCAGASVGRGSVLHPGVYLGEGASVGEDSVLHPNVVVREYCRVGSRVILHAGAVIGADGFGFAFDPAGPAHVKIPQVGIVRIEDDVELGANTCIDRATTGETVIGFGSKLDNLVQVAHNVRVGPLSLLCAQAGVSGSAELGAGVLLAGQVGVVGHIRVGDRARVGAQSGVAHDVEDGATVSGSPAVPHREWLRGAAALGQLADLVREVRGLRRRVAELEASRGNDD